MQADSRQDTAAAAAAACLAYFGGWVGVFGLAVGPSGSTSAGLGLCQRRWPVQLPGCTAPELLEAWWLLADSHDANEGSLRPGGGEPLSCSCLCWRVLRERQGALHRPKYT